MLDYWKRVAARAFTDSEAFLGSNTRKFIFGAVFTIIGAGLLYYFHDQAQAKAKVEWWLLLCVGYVVVFPIVYVCIFMRTPYVMEREMKEASESAAAAAQQRSAAAATAIEKLTQEKNEAINADPQKKLLRSELTQRSEGFRRIAQGLKNGNVESVETFYTHDWETYNYVSTNVVGYTGYGRKHPPRNTHTKQTRYSEQDFKEFMDKCDDRIRIMDELLELYS
ncbi:MAG: hypothetical protein KDB01_02065 [Planctomycetaceae bacterium]|nr:hypothetical protein [Planctomycetaceae bacterium]